MLRVDRWERRTYDLPRRERNKTEGDRVKPWQRRTIGILTLIGGVLGVAVGAGILLSRNDLLEVAICAAFVAYYLWGIWCGVRLLRSSPGAVRGALRHWACQVPTLGSPFIGYFLASGFHLTAWFNFSELRFGVNFLLGSAFTYSFMESGKSWSVGVNLFAAGLLWWLVRVSRASASVQSSEVASLAETA
jgi:hypothetical protein